MCVCVCVYTYPFDYVDIIKIRRIPSNEFLIGQGALLARLPLYIIN